MKGNGTKIICTSIFSHDQQYNENFICEEGRRYCWRNIFLITQYLVKFYLIFYRILLNLLVKGMLFLLLFVKFDLRQTTILLIDRDASPSCFCYFIDSSRINIRAFQILITFDCIAEKTKTFWILYNRNEQYFDYSKHILHN